MSDRRGRGVSNRYQPDTTTDSGGDNARWRLGVFLVLVVGIFGYAGYGAVTADPFDPDTAEAAAVGVVNDARADNGMTRLEPDAELGSYAVEWSAEMTQSGFRHGEPMCSPGGENIAYRGDSSGSSAEIGREIGNQWLNSAEHRKQIMSGRWDSQAVGIVKDGGEIYATQQFC